MKFCSYQVAIYMQPFRYGPHYASFSEHVCLLHPYL